MFQHPFHFRSILSPSSQFLHVLFKYIIHMSWTSQIRTVLIHFLWTNCGAPLCHHSDSLTQHLPCSSAPILILSEVPRAVATVFLFPDFFTLSSLIFFFSFFTYFLFLTISRFSCQPLALALFLSWYGCFSLKEFLWPHWFFCYKSILSSFPFLPLLAKQLKHFPDLIKSSHTFNCSRPWLTSLSPLPSPIILSYSFRSNCACSYMPDSSSASSSHTTI